MNGISDMMQNGLNLTQKYGLVYVYQYSIFWYRTIWHGMVKRDDMVPQDAIFR